MHLHHKVHNNKLCLHWLFYLELIKYMNASFESLENLKSHAVRWDFTSNREKHKAITECKVTKHSYHVICPGLAIFLTCGKNTFSGLVPEIIMSPADNAPPSEKLSDLCLHTWGSGSSKRSEWSHSSFQLAVFPPAGEHFSFCSCFNRVSFLFFFCMYCQKHQLSKTETTCL